MLSEICAQSKRNHFSMRFKILFWPLNFFISVSGIIFSLVASRCDSQFEALSKVQMYFGCCIFVLLQWVRCLLSWCMVAFLRVQQGRKVERGIGFFFSEICVWYQRICRGYATLLCMLCGYFKASLCNAIIFSIHSVLVFLKKEDAGLMWKLHFSSSWECSEFDVNYLFRSLQSAILQLFSKSFLAYLLKHEVFKAELFAVWFSVKLCLMRWLGTEMPQFQPRWCHTWW